MHVGLSVVGVILKSGPVVGVILRPVCIVDASFGDQCGSLHSCLITGSLITAIYLLLFAQI